MTKILNSTRLYVLDEEFDENERPLIVAYRGRLKPNGQLEPKSEDDEYSIHIYNIINMTDDYAKLHPDKKTKRVNQNLANQLLTFGMLVQPTFEQRPAPIPTVDWNKHLPRTFAEVLSMPMAHPDRAGFILSTAAEIKSIRDMGTYVQLRRSTRHR